MIDLSFNTSRLQQKLEAAKAAVSIGTQRGMVEGTEQLAQEIDRFMFVPLRFATRLEPDGAQVIAKLEVTLNVPQRFSTSRFSSDRKNLKIERLRRRLSRKAWVDYVREQAIASNKTVAEVVEQSIRRELQS